VRDDICDVLVSHAPEQWRRRLPGCPRHAMSESLSTAECMTLYVVDSLPGCLPLQCLSFRYRGLYRQDSTASGSDCHSPISSLTTSAYASSSWAVMGTVSPGSVKMELAVGLSQSAVKIELVPGFGIQGYADHESVV
jgi:hypothetical protein